MRGVEHHRRAGVAHDGQRAHVGDEIVVAEGEAALAHHDLLVAGGTRLVDHVLHFPGREELALLDVDRLALRADVDDEVGLAHQEGRRLHDVDHARHFGERRVLVHVGEHRHADLLLHVLQHLETRVDARAAEAVLRRAIRLVVRRLEDEVAPSGGVVISLRLAGDFLRQRLTLDHAGTGDEEERPVDADLEMGELHG